MTSPSKPLALPVTAVACLAILGPAGCSEDAPPAQRAVAPAPPPPPPPPTPRATPIEQLMVQLGIDERVRLPEDKAPPTDEQRRAVLEFFDAFARGDATAVGRMLSGLDRDELQELVESGTWQDTTSQITRIDVQTGTSPSDQACALGVFYVGIGFQPQLWYYTVEDEGPTFDAVPTPPDILNRLSGTDWIAAWFDIIDQEMAMADKPEEEFIAPQKNYSDPGFDTGSPGASEPTRRFDPGPQRGPGAPRKRPKPKGPPRRPPGPP